MIESYTSEDGKFTLELKVNRQLEIQCNVYLVSENGDQKANVSYERMAFFVFKDEQGVEKVYRHKFSSCTYYSDNVTTQKKMLTRVFHACIVPKIIHDSARDLFFQFHFPKKNLRDSLDQYIEVQQIIEEKHKKLKERMGL